MTRQKNLKRHVRSRMEKTGERYAAARRQVVARHADASASQASAAESSPGQPSAREIARAPISGQRISDEAVRSRTGRGWDEWFRLLDEWGAAQRSHGQIAGWLVEEHAVPGWWAQTVAVGYEQARGIRQPGQVAGGFTANTSRTIGVSVERLFEAFADEELRQQWLPHARLEIRTATTAKTLRANWGDGESRMIAYFAAKGEAKSQVTVSHERLPDRETAEQMKAYWRERMDALRATLEA